MPRLAVLTSGGDAPGMNAALHAATKVCAKHGVELLGVRNGYEGLISGIMAPLTPRDVDPISGYGGTILGSARSEAFRTVQGRATAASHLAGVDGLLVIGGNGSLTGAKMLAQETGVRVVGVPASIDNDIGCTSMAIGVDTALNTIVSACDRISDTARAHNRVFVVEVMGRHCGYLAMASSVAAGADACLFREQGHDEAAQLAQLEQVLARGFSPERGKRRILIVKAEGVQIPTQRIVDHLQAFADTLDQGVTVRATVLGHLVRGGAPSYLDRMIAGRLTAGAVGALLDGQSQTMMGWLPWDTTHGTATRDPSVWSFSLDAMLQATDELLDGRSATTQRRVAQMQAFAGVLAV